MTDPSVITPAAAGWYPDCSGCQRWWNGTEWAAHIALPQQQWPNSAPAPAAPVVNIYNNTNYRGKSVGVAFLLTFLFGPLGMFYSTISGAIIMCVAALIVGGGTAGVGLFLIWPVSILWGCIAASNQR